MPKTPSEKIAAYTRAAEAAFAAGQAYLLLASLRSSSASSDSDSDSSSLNEDEEIGEWEDDEDVTDVTIADGVTEIKEKAFWGCEGLTNLSFLKGSAITTIGGNAFNGTGLINLQGIKGVRKIGMGTFASCFA
ncbi:hypothetical protein TeGR_g3182 [Tetraparma gracilis]|uniref:Uncharacterized protein n=1 Tax=Tetraparma gracilis TaxID=2962635 RepID=A0ABQ6M9J4_9STRA|nr:hypothetical protein TeGR_g3182 [Tetraparma gracilis]